jgi:hypothetical protein
MQTQGKAEANVKPNEKPLDVSLNLSSVSNPTLARLVAEVRNENGATLGAYDRSHNRHNR